MHFRISYSLMLFFLLLFTLPLMAQDPVFMNFSEEEGLPGNDIYDVLSSDKGLLWFATDNGVSRFNGHEFINFDVSDGLTTNSVIKLYEDLFGRIWFLAYDGMLSYYEKGEIHHYEHNDSIKEYFSDNYITKILVDSSGGVLLSPRQGGKGYIDTNGFVHIRQLLRRFNADSCYLVFEDRGDDFFQTILSQIPENCVNDGKLHYIDDTYYISASYDCNESQRKYIETSRGEYVVSYRNIVYSIKDHKLVSEHIFGEEVLDIYEDRLGKIWVSTKYDKGVYRFNDIYFDNEPEHYLEGYTVTCVVQDREDDYWFCTEGGGAFFVPSFDFRLFNHPDNDKNLNVIALALSGNRLWFSTRDKGLYSGILSAGEIRSIRRANIEEPNNWIKYISIDQNGFLWLTSTRHTRYDPAGFPRPTETIILPVCLANGIGDTMLVATKQLGIFHGGKLVYFQPKDSTNKRVYSLFQGRDKLIWIGTLYGLYQFDGNSMKHMGQISPVLNERIICIDEINDMLIVGTSIHGLLFLKGDSVVYHIDNSEGLTGNTIKSLLVQNDSTIWVGTKHGLNVIQLDTSSNGYHFESYEMSDGLPSDEINSIEMHDGHIWLGTNIGLVSFDPAKLKPHHTAPLIEITMVQVNGKDTILSDHYVLEHDQNDIRIDFRGVSYREGNKAQYRYRMLNYNNEINLTKNLYVNFPNLSPGDYTFLVNAGNVHGVWNEEPASIKFTISKHFTQTIWFLIFLIAFFSAMMVLITLFLQKQRRIKEDARDEMAKMEQRMFRLQMNPHFVFNALLAIQGFMYQNNPRDAGRYLTSFAKLIRHTLYGSSEEYIHLDKEVEALKYYLDLQRLRFNEKFEYKIEMGEDLSPEAVRIPPLLIQPFLENSIEHGLQHKEEPGLLSLRFAYAENCLTVEVQDDGIGREEAMKMQKKKGKLHKSLGMEIVQKRLNSLSRALGQKIELEIIDLKDEDGSAGGTLVRLCIPFKSSW